MARTLPISRPGAHPEVPSLAPAMAFRVLLHFGLPGQTMRTERQADGNSEGRGSRSGVRRRTFLGAGLSAAVLGPTVGCGGKAGSWRYFSPSEARTLEAVCAQLIPADRDPGAREAGVVNYIDIQLTRAFRKHRAAYRQGLAAIDAESRAKAGKSFADLPAADQIEVLNAIEEKAPAFFDLLLTHARQGFYGDPRHGGNRNMASWKMVGLPFPPVRGRQHYDEPKAE
jgi:gluconate 2-dehydrogenase gamma chain